MFGVISASYTDKGGSGGQAPPLTTVGQIQIRQKHQEVEFVVNQSGTNTATNTDGGDRACTAAASAAGDWLQLNGPFNLFQIDTRRRSAWPTRPRAGTAGSPLAAIEVRQDSITGPILATANLVSTGGTGRVVDQTFPLADVATGKHELFFVFRTVTGGATGGNLFNLNWAEFGGNGVTVVKTDAPGDVGGTVPATLALTLGHAGDVRGVHPGRREDVHRHDDGERHLDRR